MNIISVSAGIILNDRKEILLTERISTDKIFSGWEFPGGKLEKDENAEQALIRELKEELNVLVKVESYCLDVIHHYPSISVNLTAFYCRIVSGEPNLIVHNGLKWVKYNELLSYQLLPADIQIAKKIIEDFKNAKN
jgi:hydrolase, NUDIX family